MLRCLLTSDAGDIVAGKLSLKLRLFFERYSLNFVASLTKKLLITYKFTLLNLLAKKV